MKITISIFISLVFTLSLTQAEDWSDNFNRNKKMIGYENIRISEKFFFNGNEVPNRTSDLVLTTFSIGFGWYLPVYDIEPGLSVGFSPHIGLLSGGATTTSRYDPQYGNSNSNEGGFSLAAFKFIGTVDIKYGGDASLEKGTSKLGIGVGVGYAYDLFVALLKYDYHTPVIKAEAVYMFKQFFGLNVCAILPVSSKTMLDNYSIYGYSISLGIISKI